MQYVLIARRWGDDESHAYPLGIYEDLELAKIDGYKHFMYRGGKYDPEIYEQTGERWKDDPVDIEDFSDGMESPAIMKSVYSPYDFRKDLDNKKFSYIMLESRYSKWPVVT